MKDTWYQKEINELVSKIAKTKNAGEVETIFDRVLTPREINDIARRLKIWEMLEQGSSYLEIQDALGVSPTIISKVSNKIGYGFRRTNSSAKKSEKNPQKTPKKSIKYKGATVIKIPS